MKKLIFLFLIISASVFGQSKHDVYGPIWMRYSNGGVVDSFKVYFSGINTNIFTTKTQFNFNKLITVNQDPVILRTEFLDSVTMLKLSKLGVFDKAANSELLAGKDTNYIKENWGGSGSTITASDGVYMDGDTVKYSGIGENKGIEIRSQSTVYGNETGLSAIVETSGYANTKIYAKGKIAETNDVFLTVDTTGAFYSVPPDTTKTTPFHLMTEAQTKREINAVDEWKPTAGGIKYILGARDSLVIKDENVDLSTLAGTYYYHDGTLRYVLSEDGINISAGSDEAQLSSKAIFIDPVLISANNNAASFNYKNGLTLIGMFSDDVDTLKFGRNDEGVHQGDYFYTTKSSSIGIISNGVRTYEVDSVGHVSFKGTYASIYRARALGDTTQSIPTGTTPTKVLAFSTNGEQSNCIADKTNDKITITKTGRYMVNLSLSYASGTNAVNWTAYIFNNGVESENIHSTGYTSTANDKRSTSLSGIINVTSVPCDIDYRVSHSHGSAVDLIMTYVNLNVNYIGE
jgi:hypothetical protein